jgi:hypothetical protein
LEDALREVVDHLRNLREQHYEHVFLYHRDLQSFPLKLHRDPYEYETSLLLELGVDDGLLAPLLFNLLNLDEVANSNDHSANFRTIFLNHNITDSF